MKGEYQMKKSLLVLLLLGLSAPAGAEVLVYNLTQRGVAFEYDGETWTQYTVAYTTYAVIDMNISDTNLVSIWSIDFWTEKDANGHNQKYYEVNEKSFELLKVQIPGKKLIWIISGEDDTDHSMVTGTASPTKIGSEKPTIPTKLTGYFKWYGTDTDFREIGTGTVSMTLNSKMTTAEYSKSGEDAANDIVASLVSNGYKPGSLPY
jgi:hypothetical protein